MSRPRLPGIVCNDDWATPATDLPYLLRRHRPAWATTQESKGLGGYERRIADDPTLDNYGVRQLMSTEATQGVAVVWDLDRLRPVHGAGHHGWQALVDGADLLTRGVVWQDLKVVDVGLRRVFPKRIRLASAHRPPARDRRLWPRFDHALRQWASRSPYPLLVGMDSNQEGGPDPLTGRVGSRRLAWHGHRIDGVLTDLHVSNGPDGVKDLPERTSDHRPLLVTVIP